MRAGAWERGKALPGLTARPSRTREGTQLGQEPGNEEKPSPGLQPDPPARGRVPNESGSLGTRKRPSPGLQPDPPARGRVPNQSGGKAGTRVDNLLTCPYPSGLIKTCYRTGWRTLSRRPPNDKINSTEVLEPWLFQSANIRTLAPASGVRTTMSNPSRRVFVPSAARRYRRTRCAPNVGITWAAMWST